MNDTTKLRASIQGLLSLAAAEEELVLAGPPAAGGHVGSSQQWAPAPLVAHDTEFKQQQVIRLHAIRDGVIPPTFAEIDHLSSDVYERYSAGSAAAVGEASRRTCEALLDAVAATSDADLLDPARNSWLGGRQLALQIVVRGFWHPMGHLGDYYLSQGDLERALRLQSRAVAVAAVLGAPDAVRGMTLYNLACVQARLDFDEEAVDNLTDAVARNGDLRANVARDADLAGLRERGRLEALAG
jgi:tetratricopeptide (TPR) repeat protein